MQEFRRVKRGVGDLLEINRQYIIIVYLYGVFNLKELGKCKKKKINKK